MSNVIALRLNKEYQIMLNMIISLNPTKTKSEIIRRCINKTYAKVMGSFQDKTE